MILRNAADAEDATHDAFLAAWQRRKTLRDPDRVDAWFGRILVNACRDRLRYQRRHPTAELSASAPPSVGEPQAHVADRLVMEAAFEQLGADHRSVLVLRFYRDMTVEQIANILGVPPGTVKSRLHHALRGLRAALESAPTVDR